MSQPKRQALGDQAIHLIRETAETLRDVNQRAKRAAVEAASVRPSPGTSDILGRPLQVRSSAGIDHKGNLRAVDTYDLVGMAPIHLKKRKEGSEGG